jgi:toxin ParE1/3/4
MTRRLIKSEASKADLLDHFAHIGQDSIVVAERFLRQAEATFVHIATNPGIGRRWPSRRRRLKGLRAWPVSGFRRYVVFYRARDGVLEVFRVLHAARDLDTALLE